VRGGRGFTLIEMVLVLAILAIAVFFVLPSVGRGTEGLRLRTEGGRIAALLRDARRQAVTRREPVRVSLDRATGAVSLTLGEAATPARRIEVPEGFRLDAGEGGEAVTFSPRGTAREAHWTLENRGGRRVAIEVAAVTGRVTLRRSGEPSGEPGGEP
jgi:general secretion pathway protein H